MITVMHSVAVMNRAGQETFLMNLFRKIDRQQIHFDFLCSENRPGDYDAEIAALGGHVIHLPPVTAGGVRKHWQFMRLLRQTLKAHPCDVFHIHTHHAFDAVKEVLAARAAGVKTVVVHCHSTSAQFHITAHKICRAILSILPIKRLACSKAAGHWMFCGERFTVIPNGLDLDAFGYDASVRALVRQEQGWDGKRIVGHVGRFTQAKNHRFLIEIFEKLHDQHPDTQMVLVGQGEMEAEIRALVAQKGLAEAVSFLGVRDDLPRLYAGMDLFLFPSLFEGLGIVLIEAQACGLPVLTSDAIPSEAFVTDMMQAMPLSASAQTWADKAEQMLSDAAPRGDTHEAIAEAGYDIRRLAADLKKVYGRA